MSARIIVRAAGHEAVPVSRLDHEPGDQLEPVGGAAVGGPAGGQAVAAGDAKPDSGAAGKGAPAAGEGLSAAGTAFLSSLVAGAAQPSPAGDPHVPVAFALGWQMAELYRPDLRANHPPAQGDDLPGLGELSAKERAEMSLDQIDVALNKLNELITERGLTPPTTAGARAALGEDASTAAFRGSVFDLHVSLLTKMTAADFKLGKAYGLGRALSDTCRKPTNLAEVRSELERHRVATVLAWIADLTTALPPHAGHSVGESLKEWRDWAANAQAVAKEDPGRVVRLLRRQGERWRSLLSGERHGADLLELADYVNAGIGVLGRLGSLTRRFLLRFLPAVLAVLALAGASVWLILTNTSSAHVAAGLAGLLVSAGLTWKGIGGSLGGAAAKVERPLWEAELDTVIADAMTLLPGSKRVKGYTPPARGASR